MGAGFARERPRAGCGKTRGAAGPAGNGSVGGERRLTTALLPWPR
jgi:hypothetical protein